MLIILLSTFFHADLRSSTIHFDQTCPMMETVPKTMSPPPRGEIINIIIFSLLIISSANTTNGSVKGFQFISIYFFYLISYFCNLQRPER